MTVKAGLFGFVIQSPPKESIHLEKGRVLTSQGGQINSRELVLLMELVKSGPNLVGKVQEMATQITWTFPTGLRPLQREYGAPPRINLVPLDSEYSALFQVYTFFWWRLYGLKPCKSRDISVYQNTLSGLGKHKLQWVGRSPVQSINSLQFNTEFELYVFQDMLYQ